MHILHGDNIVHSRQSLGSLLDAAHQAKKTVTRLPAKKLTPAELETALVSTSLFGAEQVVVIEELHSLPKSKRKDELTTLLAVHAPEDTTGVEIILWESRTLTAPMLKKFPGARTSESKLSKTLFQWLDSLGSKNHQKKLDLLHKSIATDSEHFCFLMLIRQVRLLIQAKDGGTVSGPPFMVTKLKKQAQLFSLEQLLVTHEKLLMLDAKMKRSASILTLGQELDLLTLAL